MRNRTLLIVAALLLALPAAALALPVELTPSPREDALPSYTSEGVEARFDRDASVTRSGQAAYHIQHQRGPTAQAESSAIIILTGPLVDGLNYSASAWVRTRNVQEAGLRARLRDAQGQYLDAPVVYDTIRGDNDWTKVTCTWSGVAGGETFHLFLRVGGAGEAWFDQIQVEDDIESPQRMAELTELNEKLTAASQQIEQAAIGKEVADRVRSARADVRQLIAMLGQANVPAERRRRYGQTVRESRGVLRAAQRVVGIQQAVRDAGRPDAAYLAGWASPMQHVFLRDVPIDWQPECTGRILVVRGEHEAIQLVFLPFKEDLKGVRVHMGTFKNADGATLPAECFDVRPVGFVNVTVLPASSPVPVEHDYLGWWPDPLLDDFAFDVRAQDTQPVWIAVNVAAHTPPGIYAGVAHIEAANAEPHQLPLEIEVADYVLEPSNPWAFRNLLSWREQFARQLYGSRWNDELREKFFDFLLDRRINVLSMYGDDFRGESYQTPENALRFASRGQNVFLLHWQNQKDVVSESSAASMRARLNQAYPQFKEHGLLDRAYVYGWDEIGEPDLFPGMYDELRYAAMVLAEEFPGVHLLSAGTDATYGTASPLQGLTNIAFCPLMTFDVERAAKARANGNQVWWYDIQWSIEQHLIRSRLIPWQTFKLGADGYLMWCLNRWVNNAQPVGRQVLVDWNPQLDGVCPNSSAMYVYPGEDGPISSMRLENLRDGIEDYELLSAAVRISSRLPDGPVRSHLNEAIQIPDEFTRDLTQYTTDSKIVQAHRIQLIRALEAAQHNGGGIKPEQN